MHYEQGEKDSVRPSSHISSEYHPAKSKQRNDTCTYIKGNIINQCLAASSMIRISEGKCNNAERGT